MTYTTNHSHSTIASWVPGYRSACGSGDLAGASFPLPGPTPVSACRECAAAPSPQVPRVGWAGLVWSGVGAVALPAIRDFRSSETRVQGNQPVRWVRTSSTRTHRRALFGEKSGRATAAYCWPIATLSLSTDTLMAIDSLRSQLASDPTAPSGSEGDHHRTRSSRTASGTHRGSRGY